MSALALSAGAVKLVQKITGKKDVPEFDGGDDNPAEALDAINCKKGEKRALLSEAGVDN